MLIRFVVIAVLATLALAGCGKDSGGSNSYAGHWRTEKYCSIIASNDCKSIEESNYESYLEISPNGAVINIEGETVMSIPSSGACGENCKLVFQDADHFYVEMNDNELGFRLHYVRVAADAFNTARKIVKEKISDVDSILSRLNGRSLVLETEGREMVYRDRTERSETDAASIEESWQWQSDDGKNYVEQNPKQIVFLPNRKLLINDKFSTFVDIEFEENNMVLMAPLITVNGVLERDQYSILGRIELRTVGGKQKVFLIEDDRFDPSTDGLIGYVETRIYGVQ